jgi:PAS domain-containing protein
MIEQTDGIGQHQKVLEALQHSELRYRRLFESAREGILIFDAADQKITDANPAMIELLGYSRDELLGKDSGSLDCSRIGLKATLQFNSCWRRAI